MAFTKIAAAGIGSTETVTLHSLEVLNNATVGGVLTYEDVTNVDSIGIVTARAGVLVGSGITLSKDGDVFATGVTTSTTFVGALTGNVTGNISGGTVAGSTGTFSGAVSGTTGTFSGAISGTTGTFSGAISGTTGAFSQNIAIRLSSASNNLHVHQDDSDKSLLQFSNTTTGSTTGDGFQIGISGDEEALLDMKESKPIIFSTAGTERLRINSSGLVGVGTDIPDQKLNVVDGIINVGAAVTSNDTRIQFTRKDTGIFSWVGIPNWAPSAFYIYGPKNTSPFNEVVVSYGSSTFNFFTGGTQRMSIGDSGHVTFQDGKKCAFSVKGNNMTRTNADNFKAEFNNDTSSGCFDSGSNFDVSSHEFEAPVSGYYFFHTTVRLDGWSSGYIRMGILSTSYNEGTSWWNIPSTGHVIKYSGSGDIDELTTSTTMYLPATHKAYVYFLVQNETSFTVMLGESSFSGHFIG